MTSLRYRFGIDLGGTKIEIAALDSRGSVVLRERIPTPKHDYAATLSSIVGLVTTAEDRLGASGSVGIAIPGTISSRTGLVKNANSTWLNGRPLDADLEAALSRPVRLANDANCFALSEAVDGAASGANVVFGVILGTGVGGGLVVEGRIIMGAHSIAGEWGHNPLPGAEADETPGPACYCGRRGCIETFLSGPALEGEYARLCGEQRPAADIARRAVAGEPQAMAVLDHHQDRLARALGTIVNVLDPDCIVLGGGLSNLDSLYTGLAARVMSYAFTPETPPLIRRNHHGDSSGVRGAAWLWP
ncbi:MAG: ROK family protein [Alphaproteobacteria bacterium]|nr:ROK family protein [Alphaproteobacteria bacterium]